MRFPFEKTRELLAKVNGVKRIDENSSYSNALQLRVFFFLNERLDFWIYK